ncbi:lipid-A-disaccharide synthase N-terminal domain-containing protein [Lutibaculum baratangense]|uniref:Lipid A biosynthesis-like protein n=1 Tax=Lutibaculum baratangense AMV1 TaxID=631454 RepID=V4RHM7_9HYPH|nr:lipid-A-disaccharide synthase N-terminal domain-containing protein [Lutibaculum baratangense]ESR25631.1 Lipid A biosynthesis-like protein [Lutibaculum baratangense AMV1]
MSTETLWLGIGFLGQIFFSARFLVQWIASERVRRSIIPPAFWLFSVFGGGTLLAYAIYRKDPVFIAGQAAGLLIYARNIYFIFRETRAADGSLDPAGRS